MTDRYAVFGNPIGHSKSPRIHALFAAQTRQDLEYVPILVATDGFAAALRNFAAVGGLGANVTVPFKEEAFRLATHLTARAQTAGAVNTLTLHDGEISADNTDGAGLIRDLVDNLHVPVHRQRVLILGAGGAARGALPALLAEIPADLVIANRSGDKAARLVAATAASLPPSRAGGAPTRPVACGLSDLAGRRFDLVINATSAGLSNIALDLPKDLLAPGMLAYDMVYGRDTPFLSQARKCGARTSDGLGMLVEQAAEAFTLWRGVRPDTQPVLAQLRNDLQSA
jgi:shikimate dehydrogenase